MGDFPPCKPGRAHPDNAAGHRCQLTAVSFSLISPQAPPTYTWVRPPAPLTLSSSEKCNCVVVRAFFGIAFLWDWIENSPFLVSL